MPALYSLIWSIHISPVAFGEIIANSKFHDLLMGLHISKIG